MEEISTFYVVFFFKFSGLSLFVCSTHLRTSIAQSVTSYIICKTKNILCK